MRSKCHKTREAYTKGLCGSCYSKQWRQNNPDKELKKRQRAYCKRKANGYYETDQYKKRAAVLKLKYRYGITEQIYANLFRVQNGLCFICKKNLGFRKLVVDHDHRTGKVRGLLCHLCNIGLGWVENNTNILVEVRRYLARYNNRF